jgi:hypothetical protein
MNQQLKNDTCHILAAIGVNMAISGLSYKLTQEQANESRDNVQKHIMVDEPEHGRVRICINHMDMLREKHLRMAVPAAMNTSQFRQFVEDMFARSTNPAINSLKPELVFTRW